MNSNNWLERTELLFGNEKLEKLRNKKVLIVGLGGVGAYAAEQICRAGINNMTIVDGDQVTNSNRNRQLPALISNLGKSKTDILAERFKDINPDINLTVITEYLRDDRMKEILEEDFDYVVDAIDTLSPKIYLIYLAKQRGLKIVSSMGAGGKTDPAKVQISDIADSHTCPLARILRKRLHRLGVFNGIKVVYSSEHVPKEAIQLVDEQNKKSTVGTISYMPPIFGCFVASVVIRDLIEN